MGSLTNKSSKNYNMNWYLLSRINLFHFYLNKASLISGDKITQIISGFLEDPTVRNDGIMETIGFIYRKDPYTNESIFSKHTLPLQKKYKALIFVTDRLSSPDIWLK